MKPPVIIEQKLLPEFDPIACEKAPQPLETAYHHGLQHGIEKAIYLLENGLNADQARRWLDIEQRRHFRKFDSVMARTIEDSGKAVG